MTHENGYDGSEASAQSIAELYAEIESLLAFAFPKSRDLWIRGEIQKISEPPSGHAYLDVIDSEGKSDRNAPVLKVKCWKGTWGPLKAKLRRDGIELAAGMTVVMTGSVGIYKARGEIDFTLSAIDTDALLGRIARDRAALIEALKVEGLFDAQRSRIVNEVPLSVGLVGSPGTEGFNDFLGQLERSPFSFAVSVVATQVQGASAPIDIAAAIASLNEATVDLICVVRGGGSKADLAAYDAEQVVRAIAASRVPVWTGVGHTGDESVADLVANERHITPTACGVAVVERVLAYWAHVLDAASFIAEAAVSVMEQETSHHSGLREELMSAATRVLHEEARELQLQRTRLIAAPGATLASASQSLSQRAQRLLPGIRTRLHAANADLDATRRLLSAFDPRRNLARGWSLTLNAEGAIVRSVSELGEGDTVRTRMVDGEVDSTVTMVRLTTGGK